MDAKLVAVLVVLIVVIVIVFGVDFLRKLGLMAPRRSSSPPPPTRSIIGPNPNCKYTGPCR
jgi:hypothetical protein